MIDRIDTGTRSSKIVKYNGVVYLTGQVAEGDTIEEQVQACLDNIDALLKKAGSSRENMLRVTIWLADMQDFDGLNKIWNAWVPAGHAPTRACGEAKLARPELKVEFIVDAAYSV
ncbi:MAG: RidA family protein [Aliishimia sp.]